MKKFVVAAALIAMSSAGAFADPITPAQAQAAWDHEAQAQTWDHVQWDGLAEALREEDRARWDGLYLAIEQSAPTPTVAYWIPSGPVNGYPEKW